MSELSPDLADLLRQARADLAPDEAEIAALRRAVASRVALASAATVATLATSSSAKAGAVAPVAGALGGVAAKVAGAILLFGILGAASGAAVVAHRRAVAAPSGSHASAPIAPATVVGSQDTTPWHAVDSNSVAAPAGASVGAPPVVSFESLAPVEGAARTHASSPGALDREDGPPGRQRRQGSEVPALIPAGPALRERQSPTPALSLVSAPALAPAPASAPAPAPAPASASAPAPASSPPSLGGEIGLVSAARDDLARGDGASALQHLREHELRFPNGTLREERLALRILALCALGRKDAARAAARDFARSAPDSPHRMAIRASCAGADFAE
jgi:hypothetical protein